VLGAALVATAVMAVPSPATGASDTVVQLDYRGSEQSGCPGEDDLRRMVVDQLGHDPFRPDGDRRVAITFSRTEGGFQGRIAWTDIRGRSLGDRLLSSRGRDCREIAANVAFAVALQLQLVERGAPMGPNEGGVGAASAPPQPPKVDDESHRARAAADHPVSPTERPLDPTAEHPAAATPERPAPPAGERPAPPRDTPPADPGAPARFRLMVGLGPAVGVGMMPSPAAFGRLFVAARFGHFSAELAGDTALPATVTQDGGGSVALNAVGSSAAGCAHLSAASACLLGRVGWLRGHGTGVDAPATSWGKFGEAGLRLAASRELGRFTVSLHADGLIMLSRWNVLLNQAVIWRVPRFGGLLGVDVALHFF